MLLFPVGGGRPHCEAVHGYLCWSLSSAAEHITVVDLGHLLMFPLLHPLNKLHHFPEIFNFLEDGLSLQKPRFIMSKHTVRKNLFLYYVNLLNVKYKL